MKNEIMRKGVLTGHVILNLTLKNENGKRENANRFLIQTTEWTAEGLQLIISDVAPWWS